MERDQTLVQQIAMVTKDQTNTFHGALALHQGFHGNHCSTLA